MTERGEVGLNIVKPYDAIEGVEPFRPDRDEISGMSCNSRAKAAGLAYGRSPASRPDYCALRRLSCRAATSLRNSAGGRLCGKFNSRWRESPRSGFGNNADEVRDPGSQSE